MATTTRQNVARIVAGAVVAAALSLTTGGVAAANHDPRDYWTTTPSPPWSGETSQPPAEDGEPTEGATTEPTPSPSETPGPAEPTTSTEPGGGPIQASPPSGAPRSEPTVGAPGGSADQEAEARSVDPATSFALFTGLAATLLGGGWLATAVARRLREDDRPPASGNPGEG